MDEDKEDEVDEKDAGAQRLQPAFINPTGGALCLLLPHSPPLFYSLSRYTYIYSLGIRCIRCGSLCA